MDLCAININRKSDDEDGCSADSEEVFDEVVQDFHDLQDSGRRVRLRYKLHGILV